MTGGYPLPLTSVLSGATPSQLRGWRAKGLLVPEVKPYRPPMWSFRDIIALRAFALLRRDVSLQKITKALETLDMLEMTSHPSQYKFGTRDGIVFAKAVDDEQAIDLTSNIGNRTVFTFDELMEGFTSFKGKQIPDLRRPETHVEVELGRLGGWPTIQGTRVPYDAVTNLLEDGTVPLSDIGYYYPSVTQEAAASALRFQGLLDSVA